MMLDAPGYIDQAQLDALIDQQVQMVMEMERQLFESLQINSLSCDMLITTGSSTTRRWACRWNLPCATWSIRWQEASA